MKRLSTAAAVSALGVWLLAACGGSSSNGGTPGFPPKSESDLHKMAGSTTTKLDVIGHDQSFAQPKTAALFAVVPRGLSQGEQAAVMLKVLYDRHLDTKVGHQLGSAVVLGYWKKGEVGDRFTAGRAEIDASSGGGHTAILDVIQNGRRHQWKVRY